MGLTEGTRFDLQIGKEYVVYGLTVFLGHVWYYIADESYSYFPVWNPASMFQITDSRASKFWVIGYQTDDPKGDPSLLITFHEWVSDHMFYSRLTTGDPNCVALFKIYKERLDKEYAQ